MDSTREGEMVECKGGKGGAGVAWARGKVLGEMMKSDIYLL